MLRVAVEVREDRVALALALRARSTEVQRKVQRNIPYGDCTLRVAVEVREERFALP